ncbi:MAG TPA: NAD(P)-dependent alcohol dehydrogenase [Acidobacteriaceae bacterium]|jgi:NADPH:quinone reductase-like Zn-dependent oxidoreductase|nr:NAD(P)-dependent alcohol dehydrogenase [Acidobacteriaceae bacterium]
MQAIVYRRYGPPETLRLEEVPTPVPAADQILIRVRAASVNPIDWHFLRGAPYGIRFMTGLTHPKIPFLGMDLAGRIEAVGGSVSGFQPGDEVFGMAQGAFAEFAATANVILKPKSVTFEMAAAVPVAAFTALQALRDKGQIQAGQKVLVNGAAGGVGTFAVQIAKVLGAEVTGVCSTRNLDLVLSTGAAHVVDYTQQDFTRGPERYDVLLDCIGNHSLTDSLRALSGRCVYVMVGAPAGRWIAPVDRSLRMRMLSPFKRPKLLGVLARWSAPDLTWLAGHIATGRIKPVLDRTYPLAEVPEAIRYLEQGHARGKVIITVA